MKTIKLLLIAILLLGTFGCDLKEKRRQQDIRELNIELQYQKFTTLMINDTFNLSDYTLIRPRLSYMNEYTTTYRIRYEWADWYITINNDSRTIRLIRVIK